MWIEVGGLLVALFSVLAGAGAMSRRADRRMARLKSKIELHDLLVASPAKTRLQEHIARRADELVGRFEAEEQRLAQRLHRFELVWLMGAMTYIAGLGLTLIVDDLATNAVGVLLVALGSLAVLWYAALWLWVRVQQAWTWAQDANDRLNDRAHSTT